VGLYENAVYTGIRPLLKALKSRSAYLAVTTGKPQGPTEKILDHFGLAKFFNAVAGTGELDRDGGKSAQIARVLPENGRRAVLVGDSPYDVRSAHESGIDCIAVSYGYGTKEELLAEGPTHLAESVAELTAILCPDARPERGFFLSVEGLDGSGKTTQVNMLEKNLRDYGFDVLRTREPGGCPISEKIREVVLDIKNLGMSATCEALLYAASRAEHVTQVIRPALEAGKVVLCDRYVDSSIAYQGGGRKLGVKEVAAINAPAINGLLPDCTVYLDIGHKEAISRRRRATSLDRIEVEGDAFHARVEDAFRELIKEYAARYVVVDATQSPEKIGEEAFAQVFRRLGSREA
jgi:dTMP kinase